MFAYPSKVYSIIDCVFFLRQGCTIPVLSDWYPNVYVKLLLLLRKLLVEALPQVHADASPSHLVRHVAACAAGTQLIRWLRIRTSKYNIGVVPFEQRNDGAYCKIVLLSFRAGLIQYDEALPRAMISSFVAAFRSFTLTLIAWEQLVSSSKSSVR